MRATTIVNFDIRNGKEKGHDKLTTENTVVFHVYIYDLLFKYYG